MFEEVKTKSAPKKSAAKSKTATGADNLDLNISDGDGEGEGGTLDLDDLNNPGLPTWPVNGFETRDSARAFAEAIGVDLSEKPYNELLKTSLAVKTITTNLAKIYAELVDGNQGSGPVAEVVGAGHTEVTPTAGSGAKVTV